MPLFIKNIDPELQILGPSQQFIFNQNLASLQFDNTFVPTISIPSRNFFETRNSSLSGFRWIHQTNSGDTFGSLKLQSFINAQSTGTDVLTINTDGTVTFDTSISFPGFSISGDFNMNNYKIINLANPVNPGDGVNKAYADSLIGGGGTVTLSGAITGSGAVGSDIVTTLTDINTSQITDFNSSVIAFRLDQFAIPIADINLNNQKIINLLTPTIGTDGANKDYVDTAISNIPSQTITLTGAITGSGDGTINTTLTPITVSQITDFNTAVLAFRLDEFGIPTNDIDLNNHKIINVSTPSLISDAANKGYVDTAISGIVSTVTLEGDVTGSGVTGTPITTTIISVLPDVIAGFGTPETFLRGDGDWVTLSYLNLNYFSLPEANLDLNNQKIVNLLTPTLATDGATKGYVDTAVSGITNTIELTGGVTATGVTGSPINTIVAFVEPNVIAGFGVVGTFLRGDGDWVTLSYLNLNYFSLPEASLDLNNQKIINLGSPTLATDGATKGYVDSAIGGNTITLTGTVIGSGSGTINTILNTPVYLTQSSLYQFVMDYENAVFELYNPHAISPNCKTEYRITTNSNEVSLGLTRTGSNDYFYSRINLIDALRSYTDGSLYSATTYGSIPNAKLEIESGKANVVGEASVIRATSSTTSTKIELNNTSGRLYELRSNSDGTFGITDRTSNASRMYLDTLGNLFLTPSGLANSIIIDNSNAAAFATELGIKANGILKASFGYNATSNQTYVWSYGTGILRFATSGTARMQILNSGTIDVINNHIINLNSPVNSGDAANKGYVDSAVSGISTTIQLTGGITGTGTTGSPIVTTVASVSPSAISGYPGNTSTFLRGDGTWSSTLTGNLNIQNTGPLGRLYTINSDSTSRLIIRDNTLAADRIRIDSNGNTIIVNKVNVDTALTATANAALEIRGGVYNNGSEDSCIRAIGVNTAKIELQAIGSGGHLYELRSLLTGSFDITDRTAGATRYSISDIGEHTFNGNVNTNGNSFISGFASVSTTIYGRRISGLITMQNNIVGTTVVTANTFVKVAGTTISTNLNGVSSTISNRITHTASFSAIAYINLSFTASHNGAGGEETSFALYKNGAQLTNTLISGQQLNNLQALSITTSVNMNTNDYIELWCTSPNNGRIITVKNLMFNYTST